MDLQAEVDRLRAEVESFKAREVADLREALAAARHEAAHYRAEAQRNAELGRQIQQTAQETIADLRIKLASQSSMAASRIRSHANN